MNSTKSKSRSVASRARSVAKDKDVTEETVLDLLRRNPSSRYGYTIVAHQLECSTERCMTLLQALAKRKAVQVSIDPLGQPLFGVLAEDPSPGLRSIRERGDLRFDYNGALLHWDLCMGARRS